MPAADAVGSGRLCEQPATVTTEAYRPEPADVDRPPALGIVRFMNAQDVTVTTAAAARLPRIAAAIDGVTERMTRGGRLVHAVAGTAGRLGILATGARGESAETALAGNGGEGGNTMLTLRASVDAPTAARLPQDAHGRPRKAPEAAAA